MVTVGASTAETDSRGVHFLLYNAKCVRLCKMAGELKAHLKSKSVLVDSMVAAFALWSFSSHEEMIPSGLDFTAADEKRTKITTCQSTLSAHRFSELTSTLQGMESIGHWLLVVS